MKTFKIDDQTIEIDDDALEFINTILEDDCELLTLLR